MPLPQWGRHYLVITLVIMLVAAPTGVYALFTAVRSIGGNTFGVSSCFQSRVQKVQSGTATNSANGTQTVTITSVDPTKAFLQFSTASNSNQPGGSTVRGRLASATTVEFVRVTSESTPATITIKWTVVEYQCGVTVQRGSASQTATTTDVSISAVPSTDRAFLTWSKTGDPAETDWAAGHQTVGQLTSASSLQFRTLSTPAGGGQPWYSGWSYRKALTIDRTKVGAALTDYPLLVNLGSDADLAADAQDDGDDILFTSADGTTKLSHEIESFNGTTGALVAWVRVPSLPTATNTTVYLYYGNAAATSQQAATAVWDSNFKGVWHLSQQPSDSLSDDVPGSTSAANHGTSRGSMATGNPVAGKVGNALTFDGSNDYVNTKNQLTNPQVYTAEAWVKTATASGKPAVAYEGAQTGTGATTYDRMIFIGTDGKAAFGVWDGANIKDARGTANVANNAWHHIAGTFDTATDTVSLYVDGSLAGTVPATNAENANGYVRMGSYHSDHPNGVNGYFPGQIDEVRVSSAARPSGWISTSYNNQNSPSTFYSIGGEETPAVGPGTHTIWWQVVAFSSSAEIDVQRGTTSLAGGALSTTVPLASAVDRDRAFSLVSFASSGTGADIGARALEAQLTDSSTLTIERSAAGGPDPVEDIVWQVVELKDGSRVRYGAANFGSGTAQATAAIDPVDTTRASAFASVQYGGGAAMGRTTYVSDDVVGAATATVGLSSATQVVLDRGNTGGVTDVAWYVVEWGGPRTWDAAYTFRRVLNLDTTTAAPNGYTVAVTIDHAAMVAAGQALASGDDVRVTYFDGSAWTQLDRVLESGSGWNAATTTLRFKTQAALGASARTRAYFLHYGNAAATAPPANPANVFLLTDGFEAGNVNNWSVQVFGGAVWRDPAWRYRKRITMTAAQITGPLTDFPVLVSVNDAGLAGAAQSDGRDILFTDSDGATKLDHQIESYSAGVLVAWVRKPTLSTTANVMYMYYGNSAAGSQQNPAGVWDANYKGVWHLNQVPSDSASNDITGSTGAGNHGTSYGTMSGSSIAGQIGKALNFDGGNDYVSLPDLGSAAQATVEVWMRADALTNGNAGLLSNNAWSAGKVHFKAHNTGNMTAQANGQSGADTPVSLGTWYHAVYTFTAGGSIVLYKNGASAATQAAGATNWSGAGLEIGHEYNSYAAGARFFDGIIDEARVSNTVRSAGWISTEYNNQSNPGSFLTFAAADDVTTAFTAATDQKRTGAYAMRAASTATNNWIVATGFNQADVAFEAWWRLSAVSGVDLSQSARAGGAGLANDYGAELGTGQKWFLYKDVSGSTSYLAPTAGVSATGCPTVSTWTKVTVVVTGSGANAKTKLLCNDVQMAPASGWTLTGSELTTGSVGFWSTTITAGNYWWIDDVRVRRYVDAEPVVSLAPEDRV